MAVVHGIDLLLIELELKEYLEFGIEMTIIQLEGIMRGPPYEGLSFISSFIFLIGLLIFHGLKNFIPPEERVRIRKRRGGGHLCLIVWNELETERPPLIDILTKIGLELGVLFISWNLAWISGSPYVRYFLPWVNLLVGVFLTNVDLYVWGCLIIDVILTCEAIISNLIMGHEN